MKLGIRSHHSALPSALYLSLLASPSSLHNFSLTDPGNCYLLSSLEPRSGNNSLLLSLGNYIIPVVPLHSTHAIENCAFIIPSVDSPMLSVPPLSLWGLH